MNEHAKLEIRLLGGFEVRWDKRLLSPFETRKVEALLAYLVLHPDHSFARSVLATVIWPEKAESKALTSLRHGLYVLRHVLPRWEHYLSIDYRNVRFRADSDHWLDINAFLFLLDGNPPRATGHTIKNLTQAVGLHRGHLLEGFFEEWAQEMQHQLETRFILALVELAQVHTHRGAWGEARNRLTQALQSALQQNAHSLISETLIGIALLWHHRGSDARALELLEVVLQPTYIDYSISQRGLALHALLKTKLGDTAYVTIHKQAQAKPLDQLLQELQADV